MLAPISQTDLFLQRAASQKKSNTNLNNSGATPAGDNNGDAEPQTPATPITPVNPVNPGGFNKNGQAGGAAGGQAGSAPTVAAAVPAQAPSAGPAPPSGPVQQTGHGDPNQNVSMGMDNFGNMVCALFLALTKVLLTNCFTRTLVAWNLPTRSSLVMS